MNLTSTSEDIKQKIASKVAGFTFLLAIAIVVIANYGINFSLIVPGNAVETAKNILAHETLFRLNIASNLIYAMTIVVLLIALYVILKSVSWGVALFATFIRLIFVLMWTITAIKTFGALRFLGDATYLTVFKTDQLQSLAMLNLASSYDAYYIGLPFWGLASMVCSYLWFKSRYIPKLLALFGIISSLWCVICAFAFIIFPHFNKIVNAYWFDSPMVIFEMVLGFWLLFKGLNLSKLTGSDIKNNLGQPDTV